MVYKHNLNRKVTISGEEKTLGQWKSLKLAFLCNFCQVVKKSENALNEHIERKHPFKCCNCDERFGTEINLKKHIKSMYYFLLFFFKS